MERLRAGDNRAFGELVDRYHRRLVRFAAAIVGDPDGAEDAAQETWIAAIRGIAGFEGRSSLTTWLFGICANRARSLRDRDRRVVPVGGSEVVVDPSRFGANGQWTAPPDPWPEVDERLLAEDLVPTVERAIEGLPDLQRQVVTLRDVEGLTARETCEIVEITEANQRVLLHRGRTAIRGALEQHLRGPDVAD